MYAKNWTNGQVTLRDLPSEALRIVDVSGTHGGRDIIRRSTASDVTPAGTDRIQFDLRINGTRVRPTLPWTPTEENLQRAREHREMLKARIAAGTYRLAEEFSDYVRRHTKELPPRDSNPGKALKDQ